MPSSMNFLSRISQARAFFNLQEVTHLRRGSNESGTYDLANELPQNSFIAARWILKFDRLWWKELETVGYFRVQGRNIEVTRQDYLGLLHYLAFIWSRGPLASPVDSSIIASL